MARAYTIWIVTPLLYQHSEAFADIAASLQEALIDLGHTADITRDKPEPVATNVIILGANLLQGSLLPVPSHWAIYNLEQISLNSLWLTDLYITVLKNALTIWDYSRQNIEILLTLGIPAKYLPVGFTHSLLRQCEPHATQSIDVLHYGSLNERRSHVIQDLKARGLRVMHLFGVYGDRRDEAIRQSKVVLNLHFYPMKLFEIVRVSRLLANKACVVAERGESTEYEEALHGGVAFEDYGSLVHRCLALVGSANNRRELGQRGYELFTSMPLTPALAEVLDA